MLPQLRSTLPLEHCRRRLLKLPSVTGPNHALRTALSLGDARAPRQECSSETTSNTSPTNIHHQSTKPPQTTMAIFIDPPPKPKRSHLEPLFRQMIDLDTREMDITEKKHHTERFLSEAESENGTGTTHWGRIFGAFLILAALFALSIWTAKTPDY